MDVSVTLRDQGPRPLVSSAVVSMTIKSLARGMVKLPLAPDTMEAGSTEPGLSGSSVMEHCRTVKEEREGERRGKGKGNEVDNSLGILLLYKGKWYIPCSRLPRLPLHIGRRSRCQ